MRPTRLTLPSMRPTVRHLIPALIATLLLCGCSAGITASQHNTSIPDSITIGTTTAPASLDFTTTAGAAIPQALMGNIYEGLVAIAEDGTITPQLARSWDISDDQRTYTFHLRENVTFSNGDAFNAHTADFSINRVKGDAWTNGLKKHMSIVEHTRVIDDYTLEVRLSHPSNTWLWSMGTLVGAMMSPGGIDTLATRPIGTGPYILDHWAVGTSLSLIARDDYWGTPARNNRVVFRYFLDPIALTNAVRSGTIDTAVGVQAPELIDALLADPHLNVEVGSTNGEVLLSMNHRRAPFNDLNVRKAVFYGIDRQALIDTTWEGYGIDTGATPVAPTDPWYTGSSNYPYDPDKARALLAQAQAVGTDIAITVPTLPYAQAASELLYSQLTDIGFDVTLESAEFPAVWLSQVFKGHNYDMSLIAHVEPRDIGTIFGNPDYYLGVDSPRVQALLDDADRSAPEDYALMMGRAVEAIMDEAAAVTLYNLPWIVVSNKRVVGVPTNTVSDGLRVANIHLQ
ncbi:ABC transporter substrate-binding protein [Corynebacterium felinum]